MGKASRWIINFLVGKKEEKQKKKNICFSEDYGKSTSNGSVPSTPNTYKRRWSFRKYASKEKVHKSSISLDSITPLITQHATLLECEKQPYSKNKAVAVAPAEEDIKRAVATRHVANRIIKPVKDAAATRIQAAYRSYLARKALLALKGLVKLQAVVRGHLVRKQTTATLRQMHALMAIQVRARFQRIQMAEELAQLAVRSKSSRHVNFSHDNVPREAYKGTMDLDVYETKREHGITKYYSGDLYMSERHQQYQEFTFPTSLNSPQIRSPTPKTIPGRASLTHEKPDYMQPISYPNYMANTESSRAKVRSQSEPKQRPRLSIRPKSKETASVLSTQLQGSSSHSTPVAFENEEPWFTKVFQSITGMGSEYEANSSASSVHSNYNKHFFTYEPHLNLY